MCRSLFTVLSVVSFAVSPSFSNPKIKFDTKTFDCGTVIEGKTDLLNAIFTVTNTGTSVLELKNVRPSCGCTVVKFDSLILPGKSAVIESKVRIAGYRAGPISKSITVSSNAENEPVARLKINAVIRAVIGTSKNYIKLKAGDTGVADTVFLTSDKKNLAVSSVTFLSNDRSGVQVWEQNLRMNIRFRFTSVDSVTGDGSSVYIVELYSPEPAGHISGRFRITTNHDDRREMEIAGEIAEGTER